ncbi:MAG: IS4 family transposase [Verrucomicrobiota bacterium]
MKKKKTTQPSRRHTTILRQLVELIPAYLVPKLARETGVEDQARTFSPWSHVVAMLYAQVSHAFGLNDVCDALRLQVTALLGMRRATPPARNTLSHANKERDCALAEQLFWKMLAHLQAQHPDFVCGGKKSLAWRFRRAIHIIDATTIQLVVNCITWAKHRRRKAAAKCHLRLDLLSFLPRFAIVDTAGEHDNVRAPELCAGLQAGEIVLFDKAYVHFAHLWALTGRGVFWVTRAKDNLVMKVNKCLPKHADPRILRDDLVVLKGVQTKQDYPQVVRRVTAKVEVDGEERVMVFLTNNLDWSPVTVCDLYRCRWQIEVFFKQLKQTVQLVDFLGNSANAVKWQVWTALLVHLLLRFLAWRERWAHSFTRLFTYVRAALWLRRDLGELLRRCGTAPGAGGALPPSRQSEFPGFVALLMGQHA